MNFINSCKIHESSSKCYLYYLFIFNIRSGGKIQLHYQVMYKKDSGLTRRLGACSAQHFICSANSKTQFYWFVTLQDPVSKRPCIRLGAHIPDHFQKLVF